MQCSHGGGVLCECLGASLPLCHHIGCMVLMLGCALLCVCIQLASPQATTVLAVLCCQVKHSPNNHPCHQPWCATTPPITPCAFVALLVCFVVALVHLKGVGTTQLCHTVVCVSSVVVWPCLTTLCLAAVCQHLCGNHLTKPLVLLCVPWVVLIFAATHHHTHQPSMWCDTHMVVVELLHMHHVWCTWWPQQHSSHTKLTDRWPQRVMVLHTMLGLAIQQTCACHPVVLLVVNKW